MRASDIDREAAVDLLRDHHDQGRLTLDEFTDRMGSAYGAVTLGELAVLLKDLPAPEHLEHEVEVLRAAARRQRRDLAPFGHCFGFKLLPLRTVFTCCCNCSGVNFQTGSSACALAVDAPHARTVTRHNAATPNEI